MKRGNRKETFYCFTARDEGIGRTTALGLGKWAKKLNTQGDLENLRNKNERANTKEPVDTRANLVFF